MEYQLVVVRGRSTVNALKLGDGVTTVGRQDDCQLVIKSSQVSRRHCELFERKGHLLVKDLNSANGVFVQGQRVVEQQVLEPGNELTIGPITFRVEKTTGGPPKVETPTPGDTSISDGLAEDATTNAEDDFAIAFDVDEKTPAPDPKPEPAKAKAAEKPAAPPKPAAPAAIQPAPAGPEPAPELGDDAIADFLLDLKIDDDD